MGTLNHTLHTAASGAKSAMAMRLLWLVLPCMSALAQQGTIKSITPDYYANALNGFPIAIQNYVSNEITLFLNAPQQRYEAPTLALKRYGSSEVESLFSSGITKGNADPMAPCTLEIERLADSVVTLRIDRYRIAYEFNSALGVLDFISYGCLWAASRYSGSWQWSEQDMLIISLNGDSLKVYNSFSGQVFSPSRSKDITPPLYQAQVRGGGVVLSIAQPQNVAAVELFSLRGQRLFATTSAQREHLIPLSATAPSLLLLRIRTKSGEVVEQPLMPNMVGR
jgi:hypothetical protein